MLINYYFFVFIFSVAVSVDFQGISEISKSCQVGDVTENECNKCICTPHHVFKCTSKLCNRTDIEYNLEKPVCHPDMVYVLNSTSCICNKEGHWPHENCKSMFKSFPMDNDGCKPNSYVNIECNVCKCSPDGRLDKSHCTKNQCDKTEIGKGRRFIEHSQVYGSCEVKNWYSLAPCQFCFCVDENKLVCNTGNSYSKKLQLGSYNLSVCGKELIKDAIELIPGEKALRFGDKEEKVRELSLTTTKSDKLSVKLDSRVSVEVNRENNENSVNQQPQKKQIESEDYYSDSEEVSQKQQATVKPIARQGLSTRFPYEEGDSTEDRRDQSEQVESDDEIGVEIDAQMSKPAETYVKPFELKKPVYDKLSDAFQLGEALRPYLPVVLDKVFQMALRKSMVSVDSNANCTPGSSTVFECNACFCMKNNKLLCTNTECE